MYVIVKDKAFNEEVNADKMASVFPRMVKDFEAIRNLREVYLRLGIDEAQRKRERRGLGRKIAHLPPPVFIWLSQRFPEILRNKNLLRSFLKANPDYCLTKVI